MCNSIFKELHKKVIADQIFGDVAVNIAGQSRSLAELVRVSFN